MDPITTGILAGGSGAASILGQYMANDANSAQAARMMSFQQGMSSTAHQREVGDLRLAGLNPILSATGGMGASTPGGAQAPMGNLGDGVSKGLDTAIALRTQNKDMQVKDAGMENTKADTSNKNATASLIREQTAQTAIDTQLKAKQTDLIAGTMEGQIKKAKAEGDYAKLNQMMGVLGSGLSSANQAKDLLNPLKLLQGGKK